MKISSHPVIRLFLLVFIFSCFTFIANAQDKQKTKSSNGLTTVEFDTPNGKVTVTLPEKTHAGDVISGTVIAEPKGKKEKQKIKNKNVLNGYVIDIEDKKKSKEKKKENKVNNSKGIWEIPLDIADGIYRLALKDPSGNVLDNIDLPANSIPRNISLPELLNPGDFKVPTYIRPGEIEIIPGMFDGDFSTSGITIDDIEPEIIAESPEGIFFKAPEDISGPVDIKLSENEFELEEQTNAINMDLSADQLTLSKGEGTTVRIHVSGLEGVETDVPLEISNLSPTSISMEGGNHQTIMIEPDMVNPDGTYNHTTDLVAKHTGGFSVLVNLKPVEPGLIKLVSPSNNTVSETIYPDFKWHGINMNPDASYSLKIWESLLPETEPKVIQDEDFGILAKDESLAPIFSPVEWEDGTVAFEIDEEALAAMAREYGYPACISPVGEDGNSFEIDEEALAKLAQEYGYPATITPDLEEKINTDNFNRTITIQDIPAEVYKWTNNEDFQFNAGSEYNWQVFSGNNIQSPVFKFNFPPSNDPFQPNFEREDVTYQIPELDIADDILNFQTEDAARKWVNIEEAKAKLEKLKEKVKSAKKQINKNIKNAENASNSQMKKFYNDCVKNNKTRYEQLKKRAKTAEDYIKKAEEAAKACNVDDTRKYSQYAKEVAETGRDTGGGNLGFPVPKKGDNSIGVKGHRGKGKIDPYKLEKYRAIDKAIEEIEKMEKQLEDMKTKSIMDEQKIKEYEKTRQELKQKLDEARKAQKEIEKTQPNSMEGSVMKDEAKKAVDDFKQKYDEFKEELDKLKAEQEKNKKEQEEKIKAQQKKLDDAYKKLRVMYMYAEQCNTKQVEKYGGQIAALNAPTSETSDSDSTIDDLAEKAKKAGEKAGNATNGTTSKINDADKKYFEGIYSALFENFKQVKSKAPHAVDDFLNYQGGTYQPVNSIECEVDGKTYQVNFNLRWSFGNTPQSSAQKPAGNGPDGKYEYSYDGFTCQSPININIDAKVILYWVGPYDQLASNKALLYHEFLHGQMMVEWLKDAANKDEICEAIQRICGNNESGVKVPIAGSTDNEHAKINPWQRKFQDDIEKEENKKVEKQEKEFREKYKKSLEK